MGIIKHMPQDDNIAPHSIIFYDFIRHQLRLGVRINPLIR